MPAAITTLGKLIVADDNTFLTNPLRLDFKDFSPGVRREILDMNGTRGKYDKDTERNRENRVRVNPRYSGEPTALDWAGILPWVLGAAPSGTSYPLGDAARTKFVRFDPSQGKRWQLDDVAVDSATIRSGSGQGVSVELELIGKTYSNPVGAFPAGNLDVSTQPFIFSDCVLTWNGVARQVKELSVRVANNIDRERFLNSLTLTALNKLHREITWSVQVPSGDYDDLWESGIDADGASLSAVFTNGAVSLSLVSTSVRLQPASPDHPFQAEGMLALEGEAYSLAGATPLAVTLDSTP
jgi:hypothetical protein